LSFFPGQRTSTFGMYKMGWWRAWNSNLALVYYNYNHKS